MPSLHVLILSVVCIVAGVVLLVCDCSEAFASLLLTAGVGGLARDTFNARSHAKEQTKRADQAQDETCQLRRELFESTKQAPAKAPAKPDGA